MHTGFVGHTEMVSIELRSGARKCNFLRQIKKNYLFRQLGKELDCIVLFLEPDAVVDLRRNGFPVLSEIDRPGIDSSTKLKQ